MITLDNIQAIYPILFDKTEKSPNCPVCQSERLDELHVDYLNIDYTLFKTKWTQLFASDLIHNHHRNHYALSELGRKFKHLSASEENAEAPKLTPEDQQAIEAASIGDFRGLYQHGLEGLLTIKKHVMRRFEQSVGGEDENEISKLAVTVNKELVQRSSDVDRVYHSKAHEVIKNFLEHLKIHILQNYLNEIVEYNIRLRNDMRSVIGDEKAGEILDRNVKLLKGSLVKIYEETTAIANEKIAEMKSD